MGGLWFCAKIMCFTVPTVPLQSATLVQRFLVNITLAFLAKYTVGSKPPISSALICFALGLVWYALICTMGSPSCFSLVKLSVATFSFPNDNFTAEVSKSAMFSTFWGVLDKSKLQSSRLEFPSLALVWRSLNCCWAMSVPFARSFFSSLTTVWNFCYMQYPSKAI